MLKLKADHHSREVAECWATIYLPNQEQSSTIEGEGEGGDEDSDPSWWDDEDWLMAVDLGYDESGEGNILLVSMQLANVERAKKLKKNWKKKLKGVEYFHSKEFKNMSYGVFKGLNVTQRKELLGNLSTLIHRHASIGMTARIDSALYERITTQEFRSRWGTAYSFAISMLALAAHEYCELFNLGFDVNILIENGHRHADQAIQIMLGARNAREGSFLNILTVGLGSKKDHPILQAADMLAYSEWQKMKDGDLDIYNALHVEDSRYQPEIVDVNEELIRAMMAGIDRVIVRHKEFGRRKPKETVGGHHEEQK